MPSCEAHAMRDDGSKNRDSEAAYARYLAGMDASMRQKVALTAAHLLADGVVADMGTGSGEGANALAQLYPALRVVGVDLDPQMVLRARAKFDAVNLSFEAGDIAQRVFAEASLDGIFDSSVLHHVTTFSGYAHEAASRCLETQVQALKTGGVIVVRDFLLPDDADESVLLDVPESLVPLLERTAREYRSLHATPGFPLQQLDLTREGWARFRLARRHAVEFVLRKDYTDDWEAEIKEEYTYFDRARFEQTFASLGLRVLASTPIWNPWIVRNRFEGKFEMRALDERPLPFPATNYIIVGERVGEGASVSFEDAGAAEKVGFLALEHVVRTDTKQVRDIVRRPGVVADVIPYFVSEERVYVLARTSYPRPILVAQAASKFALDGAGVVPWLVEPLHVALFEKPIAQSVEEELWRTARLDADAIVSMTMGSAYCPSPGGLQEEVRSIFVEVRPSFLDLALEGISPFSTSGRVRPIEAQQLLRAAQVGGLPDARLELNVRDLLTRLGRAHGPWLGDAPHDPPQPLSHTERASWDVLKSIPSRRLYRPHRDTRDRPFLELHARRFVERDAAGRAVGEAVLEFAMPTARSSVTVALALLARVNDVVCLGLDDDDLPAIQSFYGHSNVLVAPAWRLPVTCDSRAEALTFVRARLRAEHGVEVGELTELGGRYHPSPGATPEVVHPFAAWVSSCSEPANLRALRFVPIEELACHATEIVDGHLRVAVLRAASMLGVLR
jgi:ubiquinone/menaquinone biosynthesis C-methylase UbiE